MTSGFLRELRRGSPGADITLVASRSAGEIAGNCPWVDRVLLMPPSVGPTALGSLTSLPAAVALFREHLANTFVDLTIVPRWGADFYGATALAALIHGGRKVWFSSTNSPLNRYQNLGFNSLYTQSVESKELDHEVARTFTMLRALGHEPKSTELELWLPQTDREWAVRKLEGVRAQRSPVVALGVGAKAAKRKWPTESYIEVALHLAGSHGARFVLVGGPEDLDELHRMKKALGEAVVFDESVTLSKIAALIECCNLFIGNDSGPMHIASAAGVPVVTVSCHPASGDPHHDNSPARFGPWGATSTVLQPAAARNPCTSACEARAPHCILEVSAEQVSAAAFCVLESLKGPSYPRPSAFILGE